MKTGTNIAAVSVLALALGAPGAFAQGTLVGTQVLDDRLTDIEYQTREELRRAEDAARFGNEQFAPGWVGSVALTYAGKSGNSDTHDFALAGRFRYNTGPWSHSFGLGVEFGEAEGTTTKENAFVVYDANYYINETFYVFGLGRAERDELAERRDAFIGAGPGWRLVNTPDVAWRVQVGPGVRYTRQGDEPSSTDVAAIASSRVFYRFSPTIFLTNDTDILHSDAGTLLSNDLGVNFSMTDTLATRISYRAEYNDSPAPGFRSTDNTLGVSLVYTFR